MSKPRKPECKPSSPLPIDCATDAISECPDEQSKLMVTTKSITSVDSSSCLTDEQTSSQACLLLGPVAIAENSSFASTSSPHNSPPKLCSDNLCQPATDKSILSSCIDADNLSTVLSDDIIGNGPKNSSTKPASRASTDYLNMLASRLEIEATVDGYIGGFYEYIRPNAETSFLFSFTPLPRNEHPGQQSSENVLIGCLEKTRIDKSLPPPSLKSIKLRKKRSMRVKSLTLDDSSSQDQSHLGQGESYRATRKKSTTEPVPLRDSDSQSDVKATADRRRFDFLVSRLQQKLSERSQDSYGDSMKQHSGSEASIHSSHMESVHSHDRIPPTNMPLSSANDVCAGSTAFSSSNLPGDEERVQPSNGISGDSWFQALTNAPQQHGPGLSQPSPQQFQMPATYTTNFLPPHLFYPMLPQLPQIQQQQSLWSVQNHQASGRVWAEYHPSAFGRDFPVPAHQPQLVAWPPTSGIPPRLPPYFGACQYIHQPEFTMPRLPPPHVSPLFPTTSIDSPPRPSSSNPMTHGSTPFVPLSASVQQKIEENIEFLKATVPSFALGSRRRQKERWMRLKLGSGDKGKQNRWQYQQTEQRREGLRKDAQSHQPRLYHQPQHPVSAGSTVPMHGHQSAFNPISYPGVLW